MNYSAVTVALILIASPLAGEVVAKQGQVPEAERQIVFDSPMVVELPVELAAIREDEGLILTGFEKFVCEDTSLTSLRVKRLHISPKKGVLYAFDGSVAVGKSHDRLVGVEIKLFGKGEQLAQATYPTLDVEEGKKRSFQLRLVVPGTHLHLIPMGETVAQITLKVADND